MRWHDYDLSAFQLYRLREGALKGQSIVRRSITTSFVHLFESLNIPRCFNATILLFASAVWARTSFSVPPIVCLASVLAAIYRDTYSSSSFLDLLIYGNHTRWPRLPPMDEALSFRYPSLRQLDWLDGDARRHEIWAWMAELQHSALKSSALDLSVGLTRQSYNSAISTSPAT